MTRTRGTRRLSRADLRDLREALLMAGAHGARGVRAEFVDAWALGRLVTHGLAVRTSGADGMRVVLTPAGWTARDEIRKVGTR